MTTKHTFLLSGHAVIAPNPYAAPSGVYVLDTKILETCSVDATVAQTVELTTNDPLVIPLTGITNATAIMIKSTYRVTATLVSAAGTAVLPVDTFAFIAAQNVPFTAVSLTRAAGVLTTVNILLLK